MTRVGYTAWQTETDSPRAHETGSTTVVVSGRRRRACRHHATSDHSHVVETRVGFGDSVVSGAHHHGSWTEDGSRRPSRMAAPAVSSMPSVTVPTQKPGTAPPIRTPANGGPMNLEIGYVAEFSAL